MTAPHLALLLLIDLIWGFNLVASKVGVTGLSPILFTGLRFLVLFVVLGPFLRIQRGQMGLVFFTAITLGVLHFGLLFLGLARADDVSAVAIAIQLGVPFSAIASMIVLGERVGRVRWVGIVIACGGVLFMGFDPVVLRYLDGLLLVILAALAFGFGVPATKRLRGVGVLQQQGWVAAISCPLLILLSWWLETDQLQQVASTPPLIWAALLYTALAASLVGHGGLYFLVQRYDVSLVTPLTLLAPILSVVFGVLLLDDTLTWRMITGGTITLVGVYIVTRGANTGPGPWLAGAPVEPPR